MLCSQEWGEGIAGCEASTDSRPLNIGRMGPVCTVTVLLIIAVSDIGGSGALLPLAWAKYPPRPIEACISRIGPKMLGLAHRGRRDLSASQMLITQVTQYLKDK